eukprot:6174134-Amphidinium_carterae.1
MQSGQPLSRYMSHRRDIQQHRLDRGWPSGDKGKGKGKGYPNTKGKAKGDRSSLQALISRTRCARCGQVGHWARTCKHEPQAGGGKSAASGCSGPGGQKGNYSSFF